MPCPICTAVYVLPPPQAFLWIPRAATQPAHIPFPGRRSAQPEKPKCRGCVDQADTNAIGTLIYVDGPGIAPSRCGQL